jgi:hypothetical protein
MVELFARNKAQKEQRRIKCYQDRKGTESMYWKGKGVSSRLCASDDLFQLCAAVVLVMPSTIVGHAFRAAIVVIIDATVVFTIGSI